MLILLQILQKFNGTINEKNIKYVLKILREEQAEENAKINEFIKNMLEDIETNRKQEQQERHERITRDMDV